MRLFKYVMMSLLCLPVLVACGGGSGVSSSGSQESAQASQPVGQASEETGQVTVLIGDDRAFGWDHVWITFAAVQFITEDGQEIDGLDQPRQLDLLRLKHFTERLVPEMEIPIGAIEQVRFIISDIRLEKLDNAGLPVERHPFGFGNGNVDVSLSNAEVHVGKKLVIEFDFDLGRSFRDSTDGTETDFHPVIMAKTSTEGLTPRLTRVEGDVHSVEGESMTICDIRGVADHEDDWSQGSDLCMWLMTTAETAYFSEMDDGSPIVVASGDHIVAYGLIDMEAMEDTVIAEVIAVGEHFVRMDGEVVSVDSGSFDLAVGGLEDDDEDSDDSDDWTYDHDGDHDHDWNGHDWDEHDWHSGHDDWHDGDDTDDDSDDGVRHVVLADGAKVFDAEPKQVDAEVIAVTNYLEAEGFPPTMDGDPDVDAFITLLNHEVLVVAGDPTPTTTVDLEQVSGEITSYGGTFVYVFTNDGVDDCVMFTDATSIVEIDTDPNGVTVTQVQAPTGTEARFIDARGVRGAVCLDASSIVIDSVPFQ